MYLNMSLFCIPSVDEVLERTALFKKLTFVGVIITVQLTSVHQNISEYYNSPCQV